MNDRYSRQTLFAPIGEKGQEKLKQAHVLVVGAGALGTHLSEGLVRAGLGKLTIIDRDYVEWSNLQRQHLYTEEDARIQMPKAIAAEKRLKQLNSDVSVRGIVAELGVQEMETYIPPVDLMIDATDNFETRMLLNDAAQNYSLPWIYGACTGSYGLTYTFLPGRTPCLTCLLGALPMAGETCDTVGIISPAVQIVTANQLSEAFKLLVGDYESLRGTLYYFDIWKNEQASIDVSSMKKRDCPSCGESRSYPYLNEDHHSKTAVLCGRDTVQIRPPKLLNLDLDQLANQLKSVAENININPYLIQFTIDKHRLVLFKDGRVLIHGTKDITKAKSLYNRYIGG
ncbi:thiazole biosynthesis adenylyltransferase ThiF [Pullulanibacillus sp. KACC 23026]|uniref:thiazole biosynthesis adenylyltransferase ThiF n=1 Tax=Pullulanibacillus sp. KACC 23026 TaxID=3028315 RepID=UPI0023AF78E8|nr:thiazole biosynthesis adenylyltransferase ThiF [Pullulanibacillus sp. KACC 23026]WEG14884.1 thiazole biosynthesis adenylyltransferase ThiF [Pullulanibacillus sp. KACC 23026]